MKKIFLLTLLTILSISLVGCFRNNEEAVDLSKVFPHHENYYQLFVRSFADSNGDGVGDFNGITENLDYFEALGIEGIWLMPIHPTNSKHGYDVLDFYGVNPEYGTMEDFENLLDEANERGIKIIIDYVLNHTSNQHPWFLAFRNGEAPYDQFYRRIPSTDTRVNATGSWGQTIWHRLDTSHYYAGYFGGYMPDLNWHSPVVQEEMTKIAHFWLEKGVSGFRLDAALHIHGKGEIPASSSPLDETLFALALWEFQVKEAYPDAFIVGEVWDSFSMYANFFDSMDSVFHFEFSDLVINSVNSNGNFQYVDNVVRWENLAKARQGNAVLSTFLRNHDQDRLASQLGNDPRRLRLAAEMLIAAPGTPFLYYGEELGVLGTRSGTAPIWDESVRLPMLFENEYKATWPMDDWGYQDNFNTNVDGIQTQMTDEASLFNIYSRMLHLRQSSIALRYGTAVAYELNNSQLQGFYRVLDYDEFNREIILVLHNLGNNDIMVEETGEILYYTLFDFDGILAPKSTVIIRLPDARIGSVLTNE
ncbi:alpha-amylase family glycosyl hydrolase [Liberiplasma polymorphum]|uniref:alpha-amylase family glycosyl hydrolase n=1 Tax=Liberiplasma polymorphum TaxID=3374570 RepID=UPI0037769D73